MSKIIILIIVALGISHQLLAAENPSDRIVLAKIFGESRIQWSMKRSSLIAGSTWDTQGPPLLPVEKALAIARQRVKNSTLSHVELRRPITQVESVFYYFIAFEHDYVVVLMNGTVVLPDP